MASIKMLTPTQECIMHKLTEQIQNAINTGDEKLAEELIAELGQVVDSRWFEDNEPADDNNHNWH
tara:strand:+ start:422 stop:616 length:195 start_codon:yes stop_codon:yes gene_type:complete